MVSAITESEKKIMAERLIAALDLMDAGIALMRQNIARSLPTASDREIDSELRRWLIDQPENFVPRLNRDKP